VFLYIPPLLALTAILLDIFSLVSPTIMLQDQVALVSVSPSMALLPNNNQSLVNGPTVHLGLLGSCSRSDNAAPLQCTTATMHPVYDLSVIPNGSSAFLSTPFVTPIFNIVSFVLLALFALSFTIIHLREKLGERLKEKLDSPAAHCVSAWLGLSGFAIGSTAFAGLRMWFGKAVDDFNQSIVEQGDQASLLVASTGNGFTMMFIAYVFFFILILLALMKVNTLARGKK